VKKNKGDERSNDSAVRFATDCCAFVRDLDGLDLGFFFIERPAAMNLERPTECLRR
jgi:hypothetical protein